MRRAVFEGAGRRPEEHVAEFGCTLGEELLTPTAIYPRLLLHLINRFDVRGIVNITGGGFYDNIPRVLPEGLGVRVNRGSWDEPPVFDFVRKAGAVEDAEMFRTFNMGVGMAIIVPSDQADAVCRAVAGWSPPVRPKAEVSGGDVEEARSVLEADVARSALDPLVTLARPPRRAWTIGEVVPVPHGGQRVVIQWQLRCQWQWKRQ